MVRAKVTECKQADQSKFPSWWEIRVEGYEKSFLLANNWLNEFNALKSGDEIEFEVSKHPLYSGVPFNFFSGLKRVVNKPA